MRYISIRVMKRVTTAHFAKRRIEDAISVHGQKFGRLMKWALSHTVTFTIIFFFFIYILIYFLVFFLPHFVPESWVLSTPLHGGKPWAVHCHPLDCINYFK